MTDVERETERERNKEKDEITAKWVVHPHLHDSTLHTPESYKVHPVLRSCS